LESVDPRKQRKIVTAAKLYLSQKRLNHLAPRFDVMVVHYPHKSANRPPPVEQPVVLHVKNAFHGYGF
ncbi:MAG: YraN family protein, partial [Terriglobales bacterium]